MAGITVVVVAAVAVVVAAVVVAVVVAWAVPGSAGGAVGPCLGGATGSGGAGALEVYSPSPEASWAAVAWRHRTHLDLERVVAACQLAWAAWGIPSLGEELWQGKVVAVAVAAACWGA